MAIDFHTHAYPESVAPKVVRQLETHYEFTASGTATLTDLRRSLAQAGIGLAVTCTAATRPAQVRSANDWAVAINQAHAPGRQEGDLGPALIAFGTLHPDYDDLRGELSRLADLGVPGLKFHADFQEFYLDSPASLRMFEAIGEEFLVLLHVGDRPERSRYATPDRLRRLLAALPGLRAIAAHLGGFQMWAEAREELAGCEVFFDTSSSLALVPPEEAAAAIREFGVERVLFGSDYPLWSPGDELERFARLPLTDEERELILGENARRLLGLPLLSR